MSLGGYISQKRELCCCSRLVRAFLVVAILNLSVPVVVLPFDLAPRDRGNDADFIAALERGLLVLQEANVLFVHINIHEAPDFAFFIKKAFLDAWITALQFDNRG